MPHHLTNLSSAKYSGTGNFNANRFWQPEHAANDLSPAKQYVRTLHFDADGRKIETESENEKTVEITHTSQATT